MTVCASARRKFQSAIVVVAIYCFSGFVLVLISMNGYKAVLWSLVN